MQTADYRVAGRSLASYPGFSQFLNDTGRKLREPAKIHHVHDVEDRRDLACHVHCLKASMQKVASVLVVFARPSMSARGNLSCLTQLYFHSASPNRMNVYGHTTQSAFHPLRHAFTWLPHFSLKTERTLSTQLEIHVFLMKSLKSIVLSLLSANLCMCRTLDPRLSGPQLSRHAMGSQIRYHLYANKNGRSNYNWLPGICVTLIRWKP